MSLSGRRFLTGTGLSLATTAALSAAMVPWRGHLSVATTALVLVVPVVVGVVAGGFATGALSVGIGFFTYDLLFIPPYGTLTVGQSQNWVALVVYAAVMLIVARVVSALTTAKQARRQELHVRRLFDVSELLDHDHVEAELRGRVVTAVRDVFGVLSAVLLLADGDELRPVAWSGEPWRPEDLEMLVPRRGVATSVAMTSGDIRGVTLAATGTPLGLIELRGRTLSAEEEELLRFFASHVALSLERARLREQALRSEILEETERLQKALMGAVSHDLRTPLATIKVSASALRQTGEALDAGDRRELLRTIDLESDRLSRLVTNLLDLTRVQAGALTVDAQPMAVGELVGETLESLAPLLEDHPITVAVDDDLPLVMVDHVLMGQALTNLVENAARHSPEGTALRVEAEDDGDGHVCVTVEDAGPGLGPNGPEEIFLPFRGGGPGRGTGVGLSIAKAFVEAHGQRIWADEPGGGGARFRFTLPALSEGNGGR